MPEQLPKVPPFPVGTIPHEAYERCLGFEGRASDSEPRLSPQMTMCARILGYMLIYAPIEAGRVWLSKEILKCDNNSELKALGERLCDHFIRVFKSAKGPGTPIISLHSSDSAFEEVQQILKGVLQVTPNDQRTVKAQALVRDNYCCLITGYCDSGVVHSRPEIAAWATSQRIPTTFSNAACIFPASTDKGITK